MADKQSLRELAAVIAERKAHPVPGSYTDYLFSKGLDKILKKTGEEATEVIVAAKNDSDPDFILEVADLAYNVLVLMAERGISVDQIEEELATRIHPSDPKKLKERPAVKKL
ncbi:phosphoribosyl-ATP diphosphatase [Lacticaseibacillus jixiensis]|uniref:phosphoribosyl-ATP diphosphatase n=1 Tax=Lacticaseibacillus jixiensis TaxID=3231926 RepID=UPI0036F1F9B3